MKNTILLLIGIVAFILNGCAHGSQKETSECLEDSLPADPPLGYVIELRPLGDFSQEKAKQVRAEFVKQLGSLFPDQPKSWLETSIYVSENKEIPASCLYNQETDTGQEQSSECCIIAMAEIPIL